MTTRDWTQPVNGEDFTLSLAIDFMREMDRRGCGYNCTPLGGGDIPRFLPGHLYWLPPETKTVPFTQETVPKGALWRRPDKFSNWYNVTCYYHNSSRLMDYGCVNYSDLINDWQYSTNCGSNWHQAAQEVVT